MHVEDVTEQADEQRDTGSNDTLHNTNIHQDTHTHDNTTKDKQPNPPPPPPPAAPLDDVHDADDDAVIDSDEVARLLDKARVLIAEIMPPDDAEDQINELQDELDNIDDVREQGRVLANVIDYLLTNEEEAADTAYADEGEPPPEYAGEEQLDALWAEVVEMVKEEDLDALEGELKDRLPEEQWRILHDVREFLLSGEAEEQERLAEWNPTEEELEQEWAELIGAEDIDEASNLREDWATANYEQKKAIVWDVRRYLEEEEQAGDEADVVEERIVSEGLAKSEMRNRGRRPAGAVDDDEEGFDDKAPRGRGRTRGRPPTVMIIGVLLVALGTALVVAASASASEGEPLLQSLLRLVALA